MLTLHYLTNSRSQRILWLLEELEVPYKIIHYQRSPEQLAPPELLRISPLGKAPIITDGDMTLAESGAIVVYLISRYGNGKGIPAKFGHLDNLYFSHYAEGSLMPILSQKLLFDAVPENAPRIIRPMLKIVFERLTADFVEAELKKHIPMIEGHLAGSQSVWFAGGREPTAADYQMSFPLEILVTFAPDKVGPRIRKFVQAIHERPAYKRALEKSGEYVFSKES